MDVACDLRGRRVVHSRSRWERIVHAGQKLEPGRVLRNLPDGVSPQARQRESRGNILPSRPTTRAGDFEGRPCRRAGVICLVQAVEFRRRRTAASLPDDTPRRCLSRRVTQ